MIGGGIVEPAPRGEQLTGVGEFAADPVVIRAGREGVGTHGDGQDRLVDGHLGGEGR